MRFPKFPLALAAATFLAGAAFAQDTVTAKYNMFAPPKHPISADAIVPLVETVEQATGGTLKIDPIFGGALFGATETLDGIKGGGAEMGYVVMGYYPAAFKYGSLISDLAMVGSEPLAVAGAVSELVLLNCQQCQKEFQAQNIVYLGGHTTGVYALTGKEPIETLADLEGKKIRAAGSVWDRWLKSVGAIPVNIPTSEMFDGLSRGILDGVIVAKSAMRSQSLWDVAKYMNTGPLGTYPAAILVAVNRDFYEGLSVDQRKALLEATAQGTFDATQGYVTADDEVVAAAGEHDVTVRPLGDEVLASFATFNKADLAELAAGAKERFGIEDAEAIIGKYEELYAKWEKKLSEAGALQNKDKAAELFKEEVVSKIDPATYGL